MQAEVLKTSRIQNDSMFVMANSDMPFNPQYVKPTQLPATIQGQIATAAVGQTFGP
jgi:peptidyl-prolyl cis-trans isomerase D